MFRREVECMSEKEEVDILMKEYDALRREIDERLKTTQISGLYSIFAVVGAVLAFAATNVGQVYALTVPPIVMLIVGVLVHGWLTLEDTSRELARVEDKVFKVTGKP